MIRAIVAILALTDLLARVAAAAVLECDPSICVGDPCTITGLHRLEPDCSLDFGSQDVTIASDGAIVSRTPESSTEIVARRLTVRGSIEAAGDLSIVVYEDLTTAQSPGRGTIKVQSPTPRDGFAINTLTIEAGGHIAFGGKLIYARGDQSSIDVMGASIDVAGRIRADARGELAQIGLRSSTGSIVTTQPIVARGLLPFGAGDIDFSSHGDLTIGAPLTLTRPNALFLTAVGNLTIAADLMSDSVADGFAPSVHLSAGGDVTVAKDIFARGRGPNGGFVQIATTGSGTVSIQGTVDASYLGREPFRRGGRIFVGPSCTVALPGALIAEGRQGSTTVFYREHFDLTGGTLESDAAGGNTINCRCVDPPACTGCAEDPIGLGSATVVPPATLTPLATLAACP